MDKAYVTTPIYYPSGNPHLGSAYSSIAADVYARAMRLAGVDTKFTTGTDEHGQKLLRSAEKEQLSAQAYVDKMSARYHRLAEIVNLSKHDFIRTTEDRHMKAATAMWQRIEEGGFFYKDNYAGWYSVPDETYYTEDELIDGKSPDSGHPVEWLEEESYYFKLSAFAEKLLKHYKDNPEFIQPASRRNEVISFVEGGLRDLSVSRSSFDWGVPVPGDSKHVMYVWIDALINYLSSLGWPEGEDWQGYFTNAKHIIGKDILRFHAVYWPAMLMAAGLPLPKQVFAHGFLVVDGQKMSKSKGNVVDPEEMCNKYGRDRFRYFLMREITFGQDGSFSEEALIRRTNSELANDLGNLFQRVLSMVFKNCEGKVPELGERSSADNEFLDKFDSRLIDGYTSDIDAFNYQSALNRVWEVIRAANQYMDKQQPWTLKKENPEKMAHVLRVIMEALCSVSLLVEPFVPEAAELMQKQLGFTGKTFKDLADDVKLKKGAEISKPEGVFMRLDEPEAA